MLRLLLNSSRKYLLRPSPMTRLAVQTVGKKVLASTSSKMSLSARQNFIFVPRRPFYTSTQLQAPDPPTLSSSDLPTLDFLRYKCDAFPIEYAPLSAKARNKIYDEHPLKPYMATAPRLPLHPLTGKVDFRFLKSPYYNDQVINKLESVKPSDGIAIYLQAASGAGKTGSIFALAKKYFTLYIEVHEYSKEDPLDFIDLGFAAFLTAGKELETSLQGQNLSPFTQTAIYTCLTQLLWLSQALLLDKLRRTYPKLTPSGWFAYLTSRGGRNVGNIFGAFSDWFITSLGEKQYDDLFVTLLQRRLDTYLEQVSKDVFFAVDEAQVAQHLFSGIEFQSLNDVKRTFLSVLTNYSQPRKQSSIIAGTQMPKFDALTKSGESKIGKNNYHLSEELIDYPIVSEEEAISFVSQYFNNQLASNLDILTRIGYVCQGRLCRSVNLLHYIWDCNTESSNLSLAEMVQLGLKRLEQKIENDVFSRLNALSERFKSNPVLAKKWNRLLLELFIGAVGSNVMLPEKEFKDLDVNVADLGFALVTKIEDDEGKIVRNVSIKEPYSMEIFRKWLLSQAEFQSHIKEFEDQQNKAIGEQEVGH